MPVHAYLLQYNPNAPVGLLVSVREAATWSLLPVGLAAALRCRRGQESAPDSSQHRGRRMLPKEKTFENRASSIAGT